MRPFSASLGPASSIFSSASAILDCAPNLRPITSPAMTKLLLVLASAVVLAAAPARAASDDSVLLSTLGYTTGQSVLVTHLAIGTLADAYVGKMYKSEQATSIVTTYINVTKGMKENMIKLLDAKTLNKNDAQFVESTVETLDL